MKNVADLIKDAVKNTHLRILIFGPQIEIISTNEKIKNLQLKRIQIREQLEVDGHFVRYAEELVDPNLPSPQNNMFLQEIVIMKEFDLIFNLVETPGTIVEATLIADKPYLARKASLFIDSNFTDGLAAHTCRMAETIGADYKTYKYPEDLTECHLLGAIKRRIEKAQLVNLLD